MMRMLLLGTEFSTLFVVFPLLIYKRWIPNLPIPYLLAGGVAVFFVLRREATFPASQFINWDGARSWVWPVLKRDAVLLALLGAAVWLLAREKLFSLVKARPGLWMAIMLLYPLVSVYPQELLYRGFFFHRYAGLFGSGWGMILASAAAFGFVHIIFRNWLAVGMCLAGGLLFSWTYQQSGSLALVCVEHALFGSFLFTAGLGEFFYHGAALRRGRK